MTSTVFEIVELDDGEFVLRRSQRGASQDNMADEVPVQNKIKNKPLVSIKFSPEALKFLDGNSSDIAKVMIEAGLVEVEDLINQHALEEESSSEGKPRVIH